MPHRSIAAHADACEDEQGFGLTLCRLTLTRIPRQVRRARLEIYNVRKYSVRKSAKNRIGSAFTEFEVLVVLTGMLIPFCMPSDLFGSVKRVRHF